MEIVETEAFSRLKFSVSSRPRLSRDCNLGFFETETFRDSAKVVETETFSRLSLISGRIYQGQTPINTGEGLIRADHFGIMSLSFFGLKAVI